MVRWLLAGLDDDLEPFVSRCPDPSGARHAGLDRRRQDLLRKRRLHHWALTQMMRYRMIRSYIERYPARNARLMTIGVSAEYDENTSRKVISTEFKT
jgi:hypothetical protein